MKLTADSFIIHHAVVFHQFLLPSSRETQPMFTGLNSVLDKDSCCLSCLVGLTSLLYHTLECAGPRQPKAQGQGVGSDYLFVRDAYRKRGNGEIRKDHCRRRPSKDLLVLHHFASRYPAEASKGNNCKSRGVERDPIF